MPELADLDVIYVTIPKPAAVPPSTITEAEWDALLADMATLLAGQDLDDLTDVVLTSPATGHRLVYDETANGGAGGWVNQPQSAAITASDSDSVDLTLAGNALSAAVIYAGTGAASTAARSDHSHTAQLGRTWSFAATGVLSSGTRTLMSQSITLAAGITYDITATAVVRARNNVNSGTINLLFRVGTDAGWPQISRNVQTVGGVPVDQLIDFRNASSGEHLTLVGTGAAITVSFSVQYAAGDATDLRDGYVTVVARPRR
jgi:hypothetical protein